MPKFSIWAGRLALLYFLVGITFGGLLLINKAAPFDFRIWYLLPLHIEFLLMGWIVQLVFAVAYWIFPRFTFEPKRGPAGFAWVGLGLLNAGVWLVSLASFFASIPSLMLGRLLEIAAVMLFAYQLWLRTKPTETGKHFSEARARAS